MRRPWAGCDEIRESVGKGHAGEGAMPMNPPQNAAQPRRPEVDPCSDAFSAEMSLDGDF